MKPASPAAFRLMMEGTLVLAQMEHAGIKIDTAYLEKVTAAVTRRAAKLEAKLRRSAEWASWQKHYGAAANLGSLPQATTVFFDVLGYASPGYTAKSAGTAKQRHKGTEEALATVGTPFARRLLRWRKLLDFKSRSLGGLAREVVAGYFHPNFNLYTATTYRSSSGADKED